MLKPQNVQTCATLYLTTFDKTYVLLKTKDHILLAFIIINSYSICFIQGVLYVPTINAVVISASPHHVFVDGVTLRTFLIAEGSFSDNVLSTDHWSLAPSAILRIRSFYCF